MRNLSTRSKKNFGYINCFYCYQKGYHIKNCFYRNSSYVLKLNEKLVLLPKATTFKNYLTQFTNLVGPKTF